MFIAYACGWELVDGTWLLVDRESRGFQANRASTMGEAEVWLCILLAVSTQAIDVIVCY
jgi:hypothetical protein